VNRAQRACAEVGHPFGRMTLANHHFQAPEPAPALRVLVVEDNTADAMVAEAAVARATRGPSTVLRAVNLAQGLGIVASEDAHLVLLDLNLPDSRGLQTLGSMRVATRSPIIVVTAEDRPGLDEEALEGGAFEILHKGRLDADTIARLLRLAEGQRRTKELLEGAERAAREELRRSEARFRGLTELSSDWYWEQDEELRFTYVSTGFGESSSHDQSRILGKRRWEFEDVIPASGTWEDHRKLLEARQPFRDFEQITVRADGTRLYISSSGRPVYDEVGNFRGYRGVGSNITVRKLAEKRLAQLAQFDPVTKLPNRNLLSERLDHAIAHSRRHGTGAGVLFVDLDRFKMVNDSHGHHVGDQLLAQVGRSLKDCVRREDTVGRLGGDEFAVVIADLARPDDAAIVAQKILDSFAAPFDLDGREAFITASIGVATFPNDGEDVDTLLQCADVAMYRAKESSRNAFCFYTAEMNARTASRLQLNNDLRHALERNEFRLYYQPKVNLDSGELIGMEALLRWQHAERGLVPPLEFIPALEDSGLIVAVGDWVIEEACRQLKDWSRDGLRLAPVAVNLSARQFRRRDIDKVICRLLAEHGVSPELLELEITESSLMEDAKDAVRQLQALRAAGLRISVDDFGTGYSSLSYLTRLPLSTLKIDRGFVSAAISEPHAAAIVKMVIDMAQSLGFDVIAEGIETERHVEFLRRHGCELGQGYLFGKPMPAAEITQRLRRAL
jgi:diguanylate cyclase (GGDEF)-like protein/PAS domain S-box-containing protein